MKIRIDKLLLDRGLVASRQRAQALILAGRVLVNEQKIEKPGTAVPDDAELRLIGDDLRYVSRGGLKLEAALSFWKIDLRDRVGMDVGTSTGGFTDCMLQHGAAEVLAVDTGYGQIAATLRSDPRVKLLENTNARYLNADLIASRKMSGLISFIAIDVSFISVTLILPAVLESTFAGLRNATGQDHNPEPEIRPDRREMVILIKPQFEVGRSLVGKGGIVRDEGSQRSAVTKVEKCVQELGGGGLEVIDSPIFGAEGNREFLLHAEF